MGADTFRVYVIGGANPGLDLNYNPEDAKLKHKNLIILWNLHKFLLELAAQLGKNPADLDPAVMESLFAEEEKYLVSKLHSTIKTVTEKFDQYALNDIPALIEELFLALSRTYVQLVRDKASVGTDNDKEVVLYTLYHALREILKLFAPIAPFISEQMYQNMRVAFMLPEESVHLFPWPAANMKKIDAHLEQGMQIASGVIEAGLAAREKAKLSLRWPVKAVHVVSGQDTVCNAVESLQGILKMQVNAKAVLAHASFGEIKETVKANLGTLGKAFGKKAPQIIAKLAEESPASILGALAREKKCTLMVAGENIELNIEHVIIERQVPKHLIEIEFKDGRVYLDTTRTPELDAEGFAREIMRRVQSMRKDTGLDKRDQIALVLQGDKGFMAMLQPWEAAIKEKVGAKTIKLTEQPPMRKHAHTSEEKVKDKAFAIFFEKA